MVIDAAALGRRVARLTSHGASVARTIALVSLVAALVALLVAGGAGAAPASTYVYDGSYQMSPRSNAAMVGAMESNEDISPSMPSVYGRLSPDAASSLAAEAGRAAEAGGSLADLYAGGRVAPEAELRGYAEREGCTLEQSATGPAKYVDENGVPRLTIKSGSSRTPGSEDPHIEVRDETGQRTDPYGNPVNRRSPDNHYPYEP